ncbi:DUF2829 domain-containing protein [Facklamia languida]|uniref:Thoeris anti-defense 2-like domain-containing protein n=1 Tax=Facklamia languida CCUG 37842 TaxID=883113 RepID=H3NJ57_9LACT|nr:DUF2829 domain-containing protein [Facklamia languida]EHR37138.1 hypothetical protein HMPREF9708_00896 [Facklamia languida CCUG 37842]
MNFESILPQIKAGQKAVRQGWSGAEEYIYLIGQSLIDNQPMTPFLVIQVTGEGLSMFQPTVCDLLAEDWVIVDD